MKKYEFENWREKLEAMRKGLKEEMVVDTTTGLIETKRTNNDEKDIVERSRRA